MQTWPAKVITKEELKKREGREGANQGSAHIGGERGRSAGEGGVGESRCKSPQRKNSRDSLPS